MPFWLGPSIPYGVWKSLTGAAAQEAAQKKPAEAKAEAKPKTKPTKQTFETPFGPAEIELPPAEGEGPRAGVVKIPSFL
ncbi:MAG: hypothetical protein JTT12_01475 [Candidatus Brockarchaeota archaeon]|nr:hypothetical protein [Candidatus Brockarchaeota archaeon]